MAEQHLIYTRKIKLLCVQKVPSGRFIAPGVRSGSGPEDVDSSDDVLAADRALAHPFPTLGAGDHVTALQQDAVDGRVHTDLTQVLLQTCSAAAGL